MPGPKLHILLCAPRGFCAGVERAIQVVEEALERFGAPVYVRHEIVHNRYVVESLKAKGAVFVEELEEIPESDRPVVFSAHGVSKKVREDAATQEHLRARRDLPARLQGPQGSDPARPPRPRDRARRACRPSRRWKARWASSRPASITLVETAEDARTFQPREPDNLAWITQTTLSVDDTSEIVAVLKERFPNIIGPHKDDICYATTNRQEAVKRVAPVVDRMLVVGAPNSSNSQRLVEVAERAGCPRAVLIQRASEIDWSVFEGVERIGVTAGASAPEVIVEEVLDAFAARFDINVELVRTAEENIVFSLPRQLREAAA